ncbi:MAG: hypothetical protein C0472_03580 [Erythrobacter sp.]|nr:hypothetical protein [Erythrobacter sp.]MBA4173924.1 hypothetical protein [Hyphomicrobium sp.]
MTPTTHEPEADAPLPDEREDLIDRKPIADKLSKISYTSDQARRLLSVLYDHHDFAKDDHFCTLVVACLDYLEDQQIAIEAAWPLVGCRDSADTSDFDPA